MLLCSLGSGRLASFSDVQLDTESKVGTFSQKLFVHVVDVDVLHVDGDAGR